MTSKHSLLALIAISCPAPAFAAEYLTVVTSQVYQTTGTPKEIATKANTCISQILTSRTTDDPLIISADLDGGTIVARNSMEYGSVMRWKIRSRFTFEARDGRFRIEQTNLERWTSNMLTGNEAWGPIGKWSGSKWQEVQGKFEASAAAVAACVIDGPSKSEW